MRIGIIGGGLSGVSLQHYLTHDSEILEKQPKIGGLCSSYQKDGFTYDIGGHALFSRNPAIMDTYTNLLSDNMHYCRRDNKILYKDKYVKYPFENGLSVLDKEDILACVKDFIENKRDSYSNFKEWIYYTFGTTIAESYLIPYNEKIWKTPLPDLNTEWVDRIPKPPLEDILKAAIGIDTEGYTHQLNFGYPTNGGIESLVTSFKKEGSDIRTNYRIESISKTNNEWIVSDGTTKLKFDKLVITAPLVEILPLIENVPEDIISAAQNLKHNAIRVVMLGVDNESLNERSCVFIPDPNVIAHRVCFMGYFSKNNVPEGKSSLIAEITMPEGSELYNMSNDAIIEKAAQDLHGISILNKNEIIVGDVTNNKYGYVVPDKNYRQNINKIRDYTNSVGIELLGRFGEHDYINMDQVITRSKALAEKLNKLDNSF